MRRKLRATLVHRDRTFDLNGDTTFFIGRDPDCDLYIPRDEVSRRHAVVYPVSTDFEIFDFKSSGGVTVNGLPVKRFVLKDGDTIGIGGENIAFNRTDLTRAELDKLRAAGPPRARTEECLAAFSEQIREALCTTDVKRCVEHLFDAVFSACGQGVGFYWRVLEDRGFVVETVSEGDGGKSRTKSATLYQPVLEKLLRMHKIIFSGGTPLAPRSWGTEGERSPHFAIIPVPATADVKSVFLLQWEADEIKIDIDEVPLFLAMFSRFADVSIARRQEAS